MDTRKNEYSLFFDEFQKHQKGSYFSCLTGTFSSTYQIEYQNENKSYEAGKTPVAKLQTIYPAYGYDSKKDIFRASRAYQYIKSREIDSSLISIPLYFNNSIEYFEKAKCDGYNLICELLEKKQRISLIELKKIIAEMCLSIYELHIKNLVHRDIKPDNFLVYSTSHNTLESKNEELVSDICIKLSDCHDLLEVDSTGKMQQNNDQLVGAKAYAAPEYWNIHLTRDFAQLVSLDLKALDCYALAITMMTFIILCDKIERDTKDRLLKLLNDSFTVTDTTARQSLLNSYIEIINKNENLNDLTDLLNGLLTHDPQKRLTMKEVIHHRYFGEKPEEFFNELRQQKKCDIYLDGYLFSSRSMPDYDDNFYLLRSQNKFAYLVEEKLKNQEKSIKEHSDTVSYSTKMAMFRASIKLCESVSHIDEFKSKKEILLSDQIKTYILKKINDLILYHRSQKQLSNVSFTAQVSRFFGSFGLFSPVTKDPHEDALLSLIATISATSGPSQNREILKCLCQFYCQTTTWPHDDDFSKKYFAQVFELTENSVRIVSLWKTLISKNIEKERPTNCVYQKKR